MHTHRSAYAHLHGHDAVALAGQALKSAQEQRELVRFRDTGGPTPEVDAKLSNPFYLRKEMELLRPCAVLRFRKKINTDNKTQ